MLGVKHGEALVVSDPIGVAGAAISRMRPEQGIKAVVGELSLQGLEADLLQDDVAIRIGQNLFGKR